MGGREAEREGGEEGKKESLIKFKKERRGKG